jgi:uncharacterized membrane protein
MFQLQVSAPWHNRHRPQMVYWPLTAPFLIVAAVALMIMLAIVQIGTSAITKLGISPDEVLLILLAGLIASAINIPVGRIHGQIMHLYRRVQVFGVRYPVPVTSRRTTLVAVNVGGTLAPAALSGYLIVHDHLRWLALAAVAIVAVAVYLVARPVPGLGIAVPALLPGIYAAGTAILLHPTAIAGLAYVGGTLGALIGADLANLRKVRGLGAPLVSIGGAGTFDGVFIAGIVAVLLAMLA